MVERTISGDKEALRELMSRCTRPMYDRALEITGDVYAAKDAVRRALRELAEAVRRGECPEDVDTWAILLAQRSCDEELYYKRLIDGMIAELPNASYETRPLCKNPFTALRQSDAVSERTYMGKENASQLEAPESVSQAVFTPERRAMPLAEQMEYSTKHPLPSQTEQTAEKQPSDMQIERSADLNIVSAQAPAIKEPDEDDSIFAPKKKKARVIREEPEQEFEYEHEEYDNSASRKGKNKRFKDGEVPDLFGDDAVIQEDEYDELSEERSKGGGILALLIIVLTLVAAGLLWVIAVKLASLGYLGISDFGFADWFNEHLFKFY